MKKSFKGLLISLMAVFMLFFVTGCNKKVALTGEQFKSKMEAKGYTIIDAKDQFKNYSYIEEAYLAASSDYSYQIEYYKLSDEATAISFYNTNKANIKSTKGSVSFDTNIDLGNHSSYSLKSDGKYSIVSRIDNTVVYINMIDTYEDEAKAALKEIGY